MRIMQKIKTALLCLALLFCTTFSFVPALASAQATNELKCGANAAATGDCNTKPNSPSLNDIIARVINIISSLIAVVSVIMIMVGGFRYVTSGGDTNKVGSARSTITNAIIGLVIAVFAQVIVRFVIAKVK